jgi:hypothetical protein
MFFHAWDEIEWGRTGLERCIISVMSKGSRNLVRGMESALVKEEPC